MDLAKLVQLCKDMGYEGQACETLLKSSKLRKGRKGEQPGYLKEKLSEKRPSVRLKLENKSYSYNCG